MVLLKVTINNVLTLEANDNKNLMWFIDVALAVHADMKSHTGAIFTMIKGEIFSISTKKKVNIRSSTESDLIGVNDKIARVLWMNHFLEWQVFPVKLNIIYQDNTISINMEDNGKESLRKRTRNLDKLFNVTVLVGLKEVNI